MISREEIRAIAARDNVPEAWVEEFHREWLPVLAEIEAELAFEEEYNAKH